MDLSKNSFGLQRAERNEKHKVKIHKWQITTNLNKDIWQLFKDKCLAENFMTGQLFAPPFPPSSSLTGCPKEGKRSSFGRHQQPAPFEASGRGEPHYMADKLFAIPAQSCCRGLGPFTSLRQSSLSQFSGIPANHLYPNHPHWPQPFTVI